jgi:hypothetical protein
MTRLAVLSVVLTLPAFGVLPEVTRRAIDQTVGSKGQYFDGEDVHKVSFPRNDVKVTVDRWPMQAFMGLTSWVAFTTGTEKEAMAMGDLVLFEDEVNAVMSAALDNGLEVTALHNHFLFDNPRVMFMHISGEAKGVDLARGVRKCLDRIAEIRKAVPEPVSQFPGAEIPPVSKITSAPIDRLLGAKGQSNNGMYKAVIERRTRMHGREVGGQMGANTWAAFAGIDSNAFVDGDFAMTTAELQPVLKTLRAAGINIVAIHNHMTHEEPQMMFLHYWGKGTAAKLATALHAAIDKLGPNSATHIGHQAH